MQPAKLTNHAAQRLNQRCTLSVKQFKHIMDKSATVQLSQQRGGRLVHRLFYSIPDEAWFVAVQDDNTGEVLTTLPLAYFENFHGHVSAVDRRKARTLSRECEAEKLERQRLEEANRTARSLAKVERKIAAEIVQARIANSWKVTVLLNENGNRNYRNLGRTAPDYGDPEEWVSGHPVHLWFRERIDSICVPIRALSAVWLEKAKQGRPGDILLENLILSEEEIQSFRDPC